MFISLDLSLLFDDENISDHRVVSVCVFLFPLSQLMFDLEIKINLWFQVLHRISVAYRVVSFHFLFMPVYHKNHKI